MRLIDQNRKYKRSPYIHFLAQDYSGAIPLKRNEFDLLISLYARGITRACKKYLKFGGILLINNHQNDAVEAAGDKEFQLISALRFKRGAYTFVEDSPDRLLFARSKAGRSLVRQAANRTEYVEKEDYFVFRKCLHTKSDF